MPWHAIRILRCQPPSFQIPYDTTCGLIGTSQARAQRNNHAHHWVYYCCLSNIAQERFTFVVTVIQQWPCILFFVTVGKPQLRLVPRQVTTAGFYAKKETGLGSCSPGLLKGTGCGYSNFLFWSLLLIIMSMAIQTWITSWRLSAQTSAFSWQRPPMRHRAIVMWQLSSRQQAFFDDVMRVMADFRADWGIKVTQPLPLPALEVLSPMLEVLSPLSHWLSWMVDVSSGGKIVCQPLPRVRPPARNKKDFPLQTISSRPYPWVCGHAQTLHMSLRLFIFLYIRATHSISLIPMGKWIPQTQFD